jgi:hypothetical protein
MDKQQLLQAKDFIFADIEREIALADASEHLLGRFWLRRAKVPPGGGNFMAALALLSYTEFAGRLKNNDFSDQNSRRNFDDFFTNLGPSYQQFLSQHNVYKIFRCGLAHEYYVKQDCIIAVRSRSRAATGIGFDGKQYSFIIEPYFRDFKNAFNALCQTLA